LKVIYLITFHAFLRVEEIIQTTSGAQNNLQVSLNLIQLKSSVEPDAVEIHMNNFKHNTGKSCHILLINKQTNKEMCPITALWEYCKLRGPEEGPLFCFVDKTPISRQFFTSPLEIIKVTAFALGQPHMHHLQEYHMSIFNLWVGGIRMHLRNTFGLRCLKFNLCYYHEDRCLW